MPRLLELCCGGKSVSRYFEARGWDCTTVDVDSKFSPTIVADVRDLDPPNTWTPGEFDVVWASPPCTMYSIARNSVPRDFVGADQIVCACLEIIRYLTQDPTKKVFWFLENPASGYLRTRPFMQEYEAAKKTLCYCKYGCQYRKETALWTNLDWQPRPMCRKWFRCLNFVDNHHLKTAQKGPSKIGNGMTQDDDYKSEELYAIPEQLVADLFACISDQM